MTYKELLADVRRLFRRVRQERKNVYDYDNHDWIIQKYDVEIQKIKNMTGTKRAFSLGKNKKKSELMDIAEELENFLKTPFITKNDRHARHKQRVNKLMEEWQLSEREAENFFSLMNSEEIKDLIEQKMFDSDQIMEISRNTVSIKKTVNILSNLSESEKNEFKSLPLSERAEWFENLIKEVSQK